MKLSQEDKRILKLVEEVQTEKEPFESRLGGVNYKEVVARGKLEDHENPQNTPTFVYVPNRLRVLSDRGFLNNTYNRSNNPNKYRITERGRKAIK